MLMKGYYGVEYFPVMISKAFLVYSLCGKVDVDLFLNHICENEQKTVQNELAIDAKESIFKSENFLGILDRFKCRSKITNCIKVTSYKLNWLHRN